MARVPPAWRLLPRLPGGPALRCACSATSWPGRRGPASRAGSPGRRWRPGPPKPSPRRKRGPLLQSRRTCRAARGMPQRSRVPRPATTTRYHDHIGCALGVRGGEQVIRDLAEHPDRERAERAPVGEDPVVPERSHAPSARGCAGLDAERQGHRGVDVQRKYAGQWLDHAEAAEAAQADPAGPDTYGVAAGAPGSAPAPIRRLTSAIAGS